MANNKRIAFLSMLFAMNWSKRWILIISESEVSAEYSKLDWQNALHDSIIVFEDLWNTQSIWFSVWLELKQFIWKSRFQYFIAVFFVRCSNYDILLCCQSLIKWVKSSSSSLAKKNHWLCFIQQRLRFRITRQTITITNLQFIFIAFEEVWNLYIGNCFMF